MAKQAIRLNTKQLNQMIEEGVRRYLNENSMEELRAFDNWKERTKAGFSNFKDRVSSGAKAFGQGVKGTVNGGLDQGRQMYNQSMADSSREIADRNQNISNSAAQSANAKNSDIPEVQKIANKYDSKIRQYQEKINSLKQQKKTEMGKARQDYRSQMLTRANAYGKNRNTFQNKGQQSQMNANNMLNKRRNSLGLDSLSNTQYGQAAGINEAKLDRIIRKVLKENFA